MTCLQRLSRNVAALACAALAVAAVAPARAQSGEALTTTRHRLSAALAQSPFGRPLLLESGPAAGTPHGDVYAVLDHPYATVAAVLGRADRWCDMLILQSNIKRCVPSGSAPNESLQVAVGRKFDQPIEDAFQVDFRYALRAADARYFAAQLTADAGPLGTRDYRLAVEAVPIGARQTFLRMSYSYGSGLAARLATDAYLATAGRDKVGFSVTGRDEAGKPVHVRGAQGIAERNTMRYFLAIEAYLGALDAPPQTRVETRLRRWFDGTERHPRQLREMTWEEYIAMKRREVALQVAATRDAGLAARPPS
jgi:hypothetical protein